MHVAHELQLPPPIPAHAWHAVTGLCKREPPALTCKQHSCSRPQNSSEHLAIAKAHSAMAALLGSLRVQRGCMAQSYLLCMRAPMCLRQARLSKVSRAVLFHSPLPLLYCTACSTLGLLTK